MRCLLLVGVLLVSGCAPAATPAIPTFTPQPTLRQTPTPLPSPTASPVLDPQRIWVVAEGFSSTVASLDPTEGVTAMPLPLNEGQNASDVATSGDMLFYLVWQPDGSQRGVAAWDLTENNARFISLAPEGYRIVHILPAQNGEALALVLGEEGIPPGEGQWRLDVIPLTGGEQRTVITSEALDSPLPPEPFAWPADGPILLQSLNTDGSSQGIYALNVADGTNRAILEADAEDVVIDPRLSPDAAHIAYLAYQPDLLPAEVRDRAPTNVLRIIDLRLGTAMTMNPAEGEAIYGARWAEKALLLDIVTFQAEGADTPDRQSWARVDVGQPLPWQLAPGGSERANLFDFEPYAEGVIYTTLPADGLWRVYIQPSLTAQSESIPLNALSEQQGAPRILYLP